jgi:hypothetical protein
MGESLFQHPAWQAVGVVAGVAAVIVGLVAIRMQWRSKACSIRAHSAPVLSVGTKLRGDVEIRYRGVTVTDVTLHEITVVNSGNVPILGEELVRPFVVSFGETAHILSIELLPSRPADLDAGLDQVGADPATAITLQPPLLNPSDRITVRCLVAGGAEPKITARITGVRELKWERPRDLWKVLLRRVIYYLLAAAGAGLIANSLHLPDDPWIGITLAALLILPIIPLIVRTVRTTVDSWFWDGDRK